MTTKKGFLLEGNYRRFFIIIYNVRGFRSLVNA